MPAAVQQGRDESGQPFNGIAVAVRGRQVSRALDPGKVRGYRADAGKRGLQGRDTQRLIARRAGKDAGALEALEQRQAYSQPLDSDEAN